MNEKNAAAKGLVLQLLCFPAGISEGDARLQGDQIV